MSCSQERTGCSTPGCSSNEGTIMTELPPGRYRHYKGNEYTVLGVARHSETQQELVVYRQEYGDYGLWVRPMKMFLERVMVDGKEVPRFYFLGDDV